jgi:D-serine deaminase-like pyridoxal phosphate-dependent protein
LTNNTTTATAMSPPAHLENYPDSPLDALKAQYIGTQLTRLPTPAIILDRSKIVGNCNAMLQVCRKLGVGFRAHVKSHKVSACSLVCIAGVC